MFLSWVCEKEKEKFNVTSFSSVLPILHMNTPGMYVVNEVSEVGS